MMSIMTTDLLKDLEGHKRVVDKNHYNETAGMDAPSPIQEFYRDQTIFITGATGFLGTLLVEKLLRCCPQIRKLILLVRKRGSQPVEDRVTAYFSDDIFDRMRLTNPKYAEQVDIVVGQLDADNFGLTQSDETRLTSQTSIVFHIAATVRFDEHIRNAYSINVRGTQTAILLAKRMPLLKSFVYVSTAYCNCDRDYIEEVFYPPTFNAEELFVIVRSASDEEMAILKDHLMGGKPNTYTLTKSAAEDLVREVSNEIPICVFRPSIVFPTLQEPMPLWLKGFNSVLALCVAGGIGLLRVVLITNTMKVDIVPADRTISAMTAVAWYHTTRRPNQRTVFNYVSSNDNQVILREFLDLIVHVGETSEESCSKMLWKQGTIRTNSIRLYYALFYIFHLVPAIVFTCAERLTHRKPVIMMYYRRIFFLIKTMATFTLNEWQFENRNTRSMVSAMAEDRQWCDPSMSDFRWQPMFVNIPRTMGKYLVKDPLTKEHYRTRMAYIYRADYWLKFVAKAVALYVFLGFAANFINSYFYYSIKSPIKII